MRRFKRAGFVLLSAALACAGLAGCSDPASGKTVVKVNGWIDELNAKTFKSIMDNYNDTNTDNIYIRWTPLTYNAYVNTLEQSLAGTSGPDVIYVEDKFSKKWARLGYLEDLDPYLEKSDLDLGSMWSNAVVRFKYNSAKNTSNDNDPQTLIPTDVLPTALYYNKTVIEEQGIKVISVDEGDIDAFNNGAADRTGKTKADYGLGNVSVPKKGFYRENPYGGLTWSKPSYNGGKVVETMIFNNRIAMSWEEVEDLGMILTASRNSDLQNKSMYGYFTQWWFNYGWSVGGDCAVDTTGNGDWKFTVADDTKKCLLYNADHTPVVGTDKKPVFVDENKTATYEKAEGQYFGAALPSQKQALTRFANLSRPRTKGGLEIAPSPAVLGNNRTGLSEFCAGNVGLLVERSVQINTFRTLAKFDWDVAPLPVYKEYENLNGDAVKNKGIEVGHSSVNGVGIWSGSQVKDAAWKVIEYLAGSAAQTIQGNAGFSMPNNNTVAQSAFVKYHVDSGKAPRNIDIFTVNVDIQRPGDWWYMPDSIWIDDWSGLLNKGVRNGDMTIDEMISTLGTSVDDTLALYKNSAA